MIVKANSAVSIESTGEVRDIQEQSYSDLPPTEMIRNSLLLVHTKPKPPEKLKQLTI